MNNKQLRIEPPNWWTGMKHPFLQLLIYGDNIAAYKPSLQYNGVQIIQIQQVENPNYLFIDIEISADAKPGEIKIVFDNGADKIEFPYKFLPKLTDRSRHNGFDASDVVYLIMPDRFANGKPEIDNVKGYKDKVNRQHPDGRHGGDLEGIRQHLDYISELGTTAIWCTPIFETNMPKISYHGYAITDFYNIDPRLGSNEEYRQLVGECHKKGLKVIMDMVFNHAGSEHWFIKDKPANDWIHQFNQYTSTHYRCSVASDPYASDHDTHLLENGWFDVIMPDLNQDNPFLSNYLIQNSIWWVEFSGIDGIRMDTYPYVKKEMLAEWVKRVMAEYPRFNIVGEAWQERESMTAYWQKNFPLKDDYNSNLPSVTDFPVNAALLNALNNDESWTEGLIELYYCLAQDFLYNNPNKNVIFLDNHDIRRIYSRLNHNFNKFKMAMSFLFTTRGIPQFYYGTEILMDGDGADSHGYMRQDFPGGWQGDWMDAFTGKNLSTERMMAQTFTRKLLTWRKTCKAVHNGKLTHFLPDFGTYVYFRHTKDQTIMVIVHKTDAKFIETGRYQEFLNQFNKAKDVITDEVFVDLSRIWMEGYSARILELG